MKLSTVILTKNEEDSIGLAIESVSFSDEVLVLDDESADKTIETAKQLQVRVVERPLSGSFADQRNYGIKQAKGEWVLFLDADEQASAELKKEIVRVVQNESDKISAYHIKRRDYFWGRELKFGEVKKVREKGLIRLMRKNSGKWHGAVHEVFVTSGPVATLGGYINHYPHPRIKEFLADINYYSTLRSKELLKGGVRFSLFKLIFFPIIKFKYTYFLKLGFLDGAAGFVYAFMMSFHSFLVRAKLFQYQHFKKPQN